MAIESGGYGAAWGKDASEIMLDGYLRLGAGVIIQAIKDYQTDDILKQVDALAWFLSDGPIWLQMLELGGNNPDDVFLSLTRGDYVKRKQFIKSFE